MSRRESLLHIIDKAKDKENKYKWLQAAKLYNKVQVRTLKRKDYQRAGEIQENIGLCFENAAMQAQSYAEFKERMHFSIEAYQNATNFYEMSLNDDIATRKLRCDAIVFYLKHWLTKDPAEKIKFLDECLDLERKALERFSDSKNTLEYARMYTRLLLVFFYRVFLERNRETLLGILDKGIQWGKEVIERFSRHDDARTLARAHLILATCLSDAGFYLASKSEDIDTHRSAAIAHLYETIRLSEKINDAFLLGLAHLWVGINTGEKEAARHHKEALEYGYRTRNNFLIANCLDYLAYNKYWTALATENPEDRRLLIEEAMQFYDEAHTYYKIISFMSPRGGVIGPPSGQAEHYWHLAQLEPILDKRRKLLKMSEKLGAQALRVAENSGMPLVIAQVLHVISKTLQAQSHIESNPQKKQYKLEKALMCRKKTIEIFGNLTPFFYWNLGVMQNYLAGIEAELAEIEANLTRKKKLLEKAVLSKKKCLQLCKKVMPYFQKKGETSLFAAFHDYQNTYASLQMRLYNIISKPELLRNTIKTLQEAVESANKLDMVTLAAESYWKIAKAQGILGEYLHAAKNFEIASTTYTRASEKIPPLEAFYQDYALYMKAWSEIEKARYQHARKQYGQAKNHYQNAANLLESTERWSYFSQNYSAWASLEKAEALSRMEQNQEATRIFQKAAKLFHEANGTLKMALDRIKDTDEKDLANQLIKALDIREEYCVGRTTLEEAKTLAKKGNNEASASKYDLAAKKFQHTLNIIIRESSFSKETKTKDQQELMPIIDLCRAWHTMTKAESEASPELFLEASTLFDTAKDHSFDQETKFLAIGHSHFCKALAAGTRFEDSGDKKLYASATRHLQSAANYYLRAGFRTASEYATATQLFLDAYIYLTNAKNTADPLKKTRYYMMAEKVLQVSIGSFLKAKYPAKSKYVSQFLDKVKVERELAMSLTEILHAPTIASSTTSFTLPTPSEESAVGLERFESANIQASLITPKKPIRVGEEADLKIQVTNVGKHVILLDKIEEIIPPGFEVVDKSGYNHLDNMHLEMKGKKLAPLNTEEIRFSMRSFNDGKYFVRPTIIYVDVNGQQIVSELEQRSLEIFKIVLKDRVTSGYDRLDNLLLGGFPKDYAIILTSPSYDERDWLIGKFLEAGINEEQVVFYITTKTMGVVANLKEKFPPSFHLFICNPQAEEIMKTQSSVFRLKGVENLTELNIAILSALQKLQRQHSLKTPRRCCIHVISDVLLQHKALQTRRWLSGFLAELKSREFITFAVMDPKMHSLQEVSAIVDLFDGEISIYEKEDRSQIHKFLRVQRMTDQEYLKNELPFSK